MPISAARSTIDGEALKRTYLAMCRSFAPGDDVARSFARSETEASVARRVRAFSLYQKFVLDGNVVLDWGAKNASDAIFLSLTKKNLQLHACDFDSPDDYGHFFAGYNIKYSQLQHVSRLPYNDNTFDVVVGSGVLEHVPHEQDSMREIWRILKKDGLFIVTFLPNRLSLTENIAKAIGASFHKRRYRLSGATDMFYRNGFAVMERGYHQVFPTLAKGIQGGPLLHAIGSAMAPLNRLVEPIPVLNSIAANLYFVARRAEMIL